MKKRKLKQQKEIAKKIPYIDNWINNEEIELNDSNDFWNNKTTTDSQITQLLKFRIGQYMGNATKHIFYPTIYPNINCMLYQTKSIDIWPHLLLACTNPNIHKLQLKRYNNAIYKLYKLFLSNKTSKCYTLNTRRNNNKTQDNIVPPWLFSCTCPNKPCHCNTRLKPNILLVINHPYNKTSPQNPTP